MNTNAKDLKNDLSKEINDLKKVQSTSTSNDFRNKPACNFIHPVPTQTMTVQDEYKNNVHLDLDSGATVSFAKLSAVLSHGFKILPNQQLSNHA